MDKKGRREGGTEPNPLNFNKNRDGEVGGGDWGGGNFQNITTNNNKLYPWANNHSV